MMFIGLMKSLSFQSIAAQKYGIDRPPKNVVSISKMMELYKLTLVILKELLHQGNQSFFTIVILVLEGV
jgi:hypothetical protein